MKKLTRRQLLISLIFPILTAVWGVYKFAVNLFLNYMFEYQFIGFSEIIYIAAVVIGGILSGVLTVTLGIETGRYFLPRLLILISVIFVNSVVVESLIDIPMFSFVLLIASLIFGAVYFKNKTTFSEWIIIFLSNPVLYYTCCYLENILYAVSDNSQSMF